MRKRNFKDFTTTEFLEDDYFRNSILHPDDVSEHYWEQFLLDFPKQKQAFNEAKSSLLGIHNHLEKEVNDYSYRAKLSFETLEKQLDSRVIKRNINRRRWFAGAIAASISLVLIIGSLSFFQKDQPTKLIYKTGNGERLTITLPDNSEVKLNANSELYYFTQQWKKEELREVWMEGEGYFKVTKKNTGLKFLVHAGEMNVAVLGTEFNLRSRGEDSQVVLAEGKIELAVADQKITMKPGDLISYSKTKSEVESRQVKVDDFAAWKDGITVFNNVLSEVVKELEVLYGVKFIIKNEELKDRYIQLTAPTDGLDEVLKTLKLLYPDEISIEQKEGNVLII